MKSGAELGFGGMNLPPGLPPLECLACSNCDGDVHVFCAACKTLLCTDCARDIHNPKLLRAHLRTRLSCKFILAAFKAAAKGVEARAVDKAAKTLKAAAGISTESLSDSKDGSDVSSNALGAALMRLDARKSVQPITVVPSPVSASAGAGKGTFRTDSTNTTTTTKPRVNALALISKNGAAVAAAAAASSSASAPSLSAVKRVRVRAPPSLEGRDLPARENPGVAGDVFAFGDPALTGPMGNPLAQLEFRNLSNPFDTLGAVQIVSVSAGTDHCGAVTAMGSLFMWGSNVEAQLGCGKRLGEERWSSSPLLIEFPRHAPIKQVACGAVHTLALTQEGQVYSWGDGKMGKLGHGSDLDCDEPTPVLLGHWGPRGEKADKDLSGDEKVVCVAVSQNNSGAVVRGRADKCQLYLWGEGASGQIPQHPDLGPISSERVPSLFPTLVLLHTPAQSNDPYPELACLGLGLCPG